MPTSSTPEEATALQSRHPLTVSRSREDIDFHVEQTYAKRQFVEQLRWIAFTAILLQKAMIDYYRAYTQSALWLEDNLVAFDELASFEADLKDEWERQFEYMKLKLPECADQTGQEQAGQDLFRLVTGNSSVRLRAYDEPFFTHGTLHALADDGRVGWHPDFKARLEAPRIARQSRACRTVEDQGQDEEGNRPRDASRSGLVVPRCGGEQNREERGVVAPERPAGSWAS